MVGDNDSSGQYIVIGVNRRHRSTLFGTQFVDFGGRNGVIELVNHFHSQSRIIDFNADFLASSLDSLQNFVKFYRFNVTVALSNAHVIVIIHIGHIFMLYMANFLCRFFFIHLVDRFRPT